MTAKGAPAEPTRDEAAAILGEGAGFVETFLERNPELRPEWKYYGQKLGWALKLFLKKRNMCFVGREPGAVAMSFILGERAWARLLAAEPDGHLREAVEGATRYPEGRGIRLTLRDEADLADAQLLLEIKKTP